MFVCVCVSFVSPPPCVCPVGLLGVTLSDAPVCGVPTLINGQMEGGAGWVKGPPVSKPLQPQYDLLNPRAVGVSQMGKRWACFATINRKSRFIGSFPTFQDAAWSYDCVMRLMKYDRATNYALSHPIPPDIATLVNAKRTRTA